MDSFHKTFVNNKHCKFNASYEDFCELLDVEFKTDNIGLTINKFLIFFQNFGIKLCVIGRFGVIEMYKPEKIIKHFSCDYLVTNSHYIN